MESLPKSDTEPGFKIGHALLTVVLFTCSLFSCAPKIRSFTVTSLVVSTADSIRVHWNIRGTPTLLIHEKFVSFGTADSARVLELSLVVEKGKRQPVRQVIQVEYRPAGSFETIAFSTELEGDSVLVAKGIKSVERWSDFEIVQVGSAAARPLSVIHAGRKINLDQSGTMSGALEGTIVAGAWEIRSRLTDSEKKDRTNLPESLEIKALITPKRK